MDDTTQQIVALAIVAIVVAAELLRRARKRKANKIGCEGCDKTTGSSTSEGESPLKFYKRK